MNQAISESIQHSIIPGECADLYYPGVENTKKSCFPTYQENRFYLDLASKTSGSSSVLLFNPDQGLSDIVLTLQLPAAAGAVTYNGLALGSGWGYNLIDSLGLRIGSSSYYTFTGDQMLAAVLSDCEDGTKRNQVLTLGGQACVSAGEGGDFSDVAKRTAYVYLKCPWNSISAQEKPLPLPTDLLTQPVQLTVKLANFSNVFFQNSSVDGTLSAIPTALDQATANFKQVHMMDSGSLLARRENMNEHALAYPLRYFQNTTFRTTQAVTSGQAVQLNLTGFRQGSLKSIDMWVVKADDVAGGNSLNWVPARNVKLSINGLIYYDAREFGAQMWSLCERKCAAAADVALVAAQSPASGGQVAVPSVLQWTVIPFAQHTEQLADGEAENVVALGVPLQNSVVNVTVELDPALSGNYIFNFSYNYVSSLLLSRGGAEYVF